MLYVLIFEPRHAAACGSEPGPYPASANLPPAPLRRLPAKHANLLHLLQRLLGARHSHPLRILPL